MRKVKDYFVILLGLAMVAFSVSTLIVPNRIIQGGVSGLSAIISICPEYLYHWPTL